MKNIPPYSIELLEEDQEKLSFVFVSKGKREVIKIIEYTAFRNFNGKKVFNLGFGDLDRKTGDVLDDTNSNNGDAFKVFQTVLSSIPLFFERNKNAAVFVTGSDTRRLRIYEAYVNRNLKKLVKSYIFFGLLSEEGWDLEQYLLDNEYHGILMYEKK